jgi:hypothetical protein
MQVELGMILMFIKQADDFLAKIYIISADLHDKTVILFSRFDYIKFPDY